MIMSYILTCVLFILGTLFGFIFGWSTGKERTNSLLAVLVTEMTFLRERSKIKADRIRNAFQLERKEEASRLDSEMAGEREIFMSIQYVISDWCNEHNKKDPFAL